MRNRGRTLLVAFFAFSVLAGNNAMAIDPCTFITQEEAAAILGEEVSAPKAGKTVGLAVGRSCTYYTAAPLSERGAVGSLYLAVYDDETLQREASVYSSASDYFKRLRDATGSHAGSRIRDIDELGESAYWQGGADRIHILANGHYFVLGIKDLTRISSDKGRDDLDAKISAHRMGRCLQTARTYLLPKLK